MLSSSNAVYKKGKSFPLQAQGAQRIPGRFPDYVTMAQDGRKVVSLTNRPFYPQEILLVLIYVRG